VVLKNIFSDVVMLFFRKKYRLKYTILINMTDIQQSPPECQWDSNTDCQTCKQKKCGNCAVGRPCPECVLKSKFTCFAFCNDAAPDFDIKESADSQWIDFGRWIELYPIVKCLRDRDSSKKMKYFPGFCKKHCENFPALNSQWNDLSDEQQNVFLFMLNPNKCDIFKFSKLLTLPKYQNISYDVLWDILFSPLGLMTIDPVYYVFILQTYVFNIINEYTRKKLLNLWETQQLDFQRAVNIIKENATSSRSQDYSFLVKHIAQPNTVSWLLPQKSSLKVMNWNMLNYKLTMMFMASVSEEVASFFIPFSNDWQYRWQEKSVEHFGSIMMNNNFRDAWEKLMSALQLTASASNCSMMKEKDLPSSDILLRYEKCEDNI
jgi:hypothetical protein